MMRFPRRGEVWIARLDPTVGAEINKTRPVCVISNNTNNEHAPVLTVLPISDVGSKIYPVEVELKAADTGLKKDSKVQCQQIRTLDKQRLVKCVADLSRDRIRAIEKALAIQLGIIT